MSLFSFHAHKLQENSDTSMGVKISERNNKRIIYITARYLVNKPPFGRRYIGG